MVCNSKCCAPRIIPNRIDIKWVAPASPVFPYTADQIAAITGYVLNHNASQGPVTVFFQRYGTSLPFSITAQPGEYKSFTIVGIDSIEIDPGTNITTGELNININFNPF